MRSSTLVLLSLISVQAALNMWGHAQAQGPTNQNAGKGHSSRPYSHSPQDSTYDDLIPTVDPKLFNKHRYRSPRVLFSDVAPSDSEMAGSRSARVRRRANEFLHRGEYSVCDSENHWVGNLTRATDLAGNEVTVLPDVRINNVVKKQFFYETTCRVSRPSGATRGRGASGVKAGTSGCRGIDNKHWNSYCTNTHTYVRALTSFKNQIAWRLIRINAACVCVLSRKSWRH
ncbi:neurotrophin-7 [Electrophorus electricus]|uniref:Nerve growth factor-related domain-containing protein n=2 Tax=Electrophorus TaxID=8004 RepID=A0A4W4FCS8_ELEEL|nr:neurotrophin-7 [Electrophorus electricus]XP_026882482.1 neurotrophin-7 [Electrophorus electricus]XP_026882483.1 neurotrophin-7 [Electrophorus electricus]